MLTESLLWGGLVDNGSKGELVARLLFVLARDSLSLQTVALNTDFPFSRPFKVADFLNHIFGPRVVDRLLEQSLTLRLPRRSVSNWDAKYNFRAGICNFSHFVRVLDPLPDNRLEFENVLMMLLLRNAALQLAPVQECWDLLLRIYIGDVNLPYDRSHLSAIFIQVKNRQLGPELVLGPEYNAYHHAKQLGICIRMELSMEHGPSQVIMRLATPSDPAVFGMAVKGCNLATYPFLGCHPDLLSRCNALLQTMTLVPFAAERDAAEKLGCLQVKSLPITRYSRGRQPPVVGPQTMHRLVVAKSPPSRRWIVGACVDLVIEAPRDGPCSRSFALICLFTSVDEHNAVEIFSTRSNSFL